MTAPTSPPTPDAPAAASKNLGHTASRGAAVTASGLWLKTLIQLASTMLLARLLDPSDFGLVVMIMASVPNRSSRWNDACIGIARPFSRSVGATASVSTSS